MIHERTAFVHKRNVKIYQYRIQSYGLWGKILAIFEQMLQNLKVAINNDKVGIDTIFQLNG